MLVLIAGLAFLSAAAAQTDAPGVGVDLRPYNLTAAIMFLQSDMNNDTNITRAEFDKGFSIYDYNGDKVIERHEYVCYITKSNSYLGNLAHAWYDEYDMDHDHRLEKRDFDHLFDKIDADDDKVVGQAEFVNFFTRLLVKTEQFSLKGHQHVFHNDSYCTSRGFAHG